MTLASFGSGMLVGAILLLILMLTLANRRAAVPAKRIIEKEAGASAIR